MDPTQTMIDDACTFLRSHSAGDLRFDEHTRQIKYVAAPDGRLVSPVMVAMLDAVETVLFVPEERDGAMELLVTLEQLDENGPLGGLTDRWLIYHGEPEDIRWAIFLIDAARHEGCVIDGEVMIRPNLLAGDEAALCRWINTEHAEDLRWICRHVDGRDVERPLLVGIDPGGLDVRRRFDVIRIPAPTPMPTAVLARHAIGAMITEAREQAEAGDG